MQANPSHRKLFHFHCCPFESGKYGGERENYKKLNISRMKRAF